MKLRLWTPDGPEVIPYKFMQKKGYDDWLPFSTDIMFSNIEETLQYVTLLEKYTSPKFGFTSLPLEVEQ